MTLLSTPICQKFPYTLTYVIHCVFDNRDTKHNSLKGFYINLLTIIENSILSQEVKHQGVLFLKNHNKFQTYATENWKAVTPHQQPSYLWNYYIKIDSNNINLVCLAGFCTHYKNTTYACANEGFLSERKSNIQVSI